MRSRCAGFVWIQKKYNENQSHDHIAIGFYVEIQIELVTMDIQNIDGFELVVAVPLEHEHRFRDKVLDFDGAEYHMIARSGSI